jgi:hypothetical protein
MRYRYFVLAAVLGFLALAQPTIAQFTPTPTVIYDPDTGLAVTIAGDVIEDEAETGGTSGPLVMTVRRNTPAGSAGSNGDYATLNTDELGRVWSRHANPCADHDRISSVAIDTASAGNVQLVALDSGDIVYVCGYDVVASGAVSVQFIYGTGAACGTGETDLSGPMAMITGTPLAVSNAGAVQFKNAVSNALCIELSGATQVSGMLKYVRTDAP